MLTVITKVHHTISMIRPPRMNIIVHFGLTIDLYHLPLFRRLRWSSSVRNERFRRQKIIRKPDWPGTSARRRQSETDGETSDAHYPKKHFTSIALVFLGSSVGQASLTSGFSHNSPLWRNMHSSLECPLSWNIQLPQLPDRTYSHVCPKRQPRMIAHIHITNTFLWY